MNNPAGDSALREARRLRAPRERTVRGGESSRPWTAPRIVALVLVVGFVALFHYYVLAVALALAAAVLARKRPHLSVGPDRTERFPPGEDDLAKAERLELGAAGEKTTAELLAPLEAEGWRILHDRGIPGKTANLDHIAIGPRNQLVVIDSKNWTPVPGAEVRLLNDGRLMYGRHDRTEQVDTFLWELKFVREDLPVTPKAIMVIHGPPVHRGRLPLPNLHIVGADDLLNAVRTAQSTGKQDLLAHCLIRFKPYHEQEQEVARAALPRR
ncbi:nuclease-related domain-containing protein [Kitasatospora sp. McL0602]|uniref:nuclease-related domain-containing protein n=1 Tax=Kitasatospora sp. McL0602 TaxID=3439530 RepID=UPI003F8C49DF